MQTFKELTTDWRDIIVREVDENWELIGGYKVDMSKVSEELENAWSFFSTIGKALVYADSYNSYKLVKAFEDRMIQACEYINNEYKIPLSINWL